ncbi:type VI secretion system baseplate subunit TssG, partial [Burkholderia sola]
MKPYAPQDVPSGDALPNLEPLVASLLARAPRMNFMQLCRLLEVRVPDSPGLGTRDTAEHEPVRFRPRPRVGFPAGEISAVEFDDERPDVPPTVRTTFMG